MFFGSYGEKGDNSRGIIPDVALKYTLELLDFKKGKESWAMTIDERILFMEQKKLQGNEYLKLQRIDRALARYKEAFLVFRYLKHLTQEQVYNDCLLSKELSPAISYLF